MSQVVKDPNLIRFENASRKLFAKESRAELRKYKEKGLKSSAKSLISFISTKDKTNELTFLDVGCGSGRICFELVKKNAKKVIGIDYSAESIEEAKALKEELNLSSNVEFYGENFLESSYSSKNVDVLILHQVLCCYPELDLMLTKIIETNQTDIYITIPPGHFLARLFIKPVKFMSRIFSGGYFPSMHSHKYIKTFLETHGYTCTYRKRNNIWSTFVYQRNQLEDSKE